MDDTCVLKAAELITSASSSPSIAVTAGAGVGMSSESAAMEPLPSVITPTPMTAALESILGVALARSDLVRSVIVSQTRAMNNTVGRYAMRAALKTVDSFHAAPILKGDTHLVAMRRIQGGLTVDVAEQNTFVRGQNPTSSTSSGQETTPPSSPRELNGTNLHSPVSNELGGANGLDILRSPESMSAFLNAAKALILDQKLAQASFANANSDSSETKDTANLSPNFQLIPESVDPIPLLAVLRATTKGAVTARDFMPLAALKSFSPLFERAGLGIMPFACDPNSAFVAVLGHRSALQDAPNLANQSGAAETDNPTNPGASNPEATGKSTAAAVGTPTNESKSANLAIPSRFKAALQGGCHALPDAFTTLPAVFSHITGVPPHYNPPANYKVADTGKTGNKAVSANANNTPPIQSATVNSVISLARLFNIRALCETLTPLVSSIESKRNETENDSKEVAFTFSERLKAVLPSFILASPAAASALTQLAKLIPSSSEPQVQSSSSSGETGPTSPTANRAAQGIRGLQTLLVVNEGDFASVDMIRRARPFAVRATITDDTSSAPLRSNASTSRVRFVSAASHFI